MDDKGPFIVYYALAAVFVVSALISRRIPLGKSLKMALAWIGIFAVVFGVFAFRDDFTAFGQRLRAEATGSPIIRGQSVRIPIANDGQFWVDGKVNGHGIRFVVDSGASKTAISRAEAAAAGIVTENDRAAISTANGPTTVVLARAASFSVGPIERSDFAIDVSDRDDVNLLGMNFLSSLQSWRVEGNYLVLQP